MNSNDPTRGEARRQLLEDSPQDQRLAASLLPSWVPKAWLPLPCPLLPPGAGGLAVISSPDPETGKRAAGSFLHFEELHPCEGQNTDKGATPGGEEQGKPPPHPSETGWRQTGQLRPKSGLSPADSTVAPKE